MAEISRSFLPPYRVPITKAGAKLSEYWEYFFRSVFERLYPLGEEKQFTLVNGQSSTAEITGAKFNPRGVTCVFFEYLVQRVTDTTELTETGLLIFTYRPTSEVWSRVAVSEETPQNAGILITINTSGQLVYTTTNISGTEVISSLWYRARTLSGKNALYSSQGAS